MRDVEDALLKAYGIKKPKEKEEEKVKICPKCGARCPPFLYECNKCGALLTGEEELKKLMREIEDWSLVLLAFFKILKRKHPDIWEDLRFALQKTGKIYLIE